MLYTRHVLANIGLAVTEKKERKERKNKSKKARRNLRQQPAAVQTRFGQCGLDCTLNCQSSLSTA